MFCDKFFSFMKLKVSLYHLIIEVVRSEDAACGSAGTLRITGTAVIQCKELLFSN